MAPARSISLNAVATNTAEPILNNPFLDNAIQVLSQLSDVGKALPFISPAFVLLKVIIDIEQRAQDVDAKCNDLLERITFMLSHIPLLRTMEVMPATRQVMDRIIESLKQAAALITSYRRQSAVARRLSITNRDKFTTAAHNVNTCCQDLMLSLQIHQSSKIEILTRDIPIDDDDKAAETFVAEHGSLEAIQHDRELVKEFAQQQHLVMDDTVMDQLNANLADTIQQNQARLEVILKDNVNSAVLDGFKGLVAELNAAESEQRFHCVQCDKEFTNATNGPKSCSFHRAEYDSWGNSYSCCGTDHPCQFQPHRAKHHCDYPYGAFFPRARAITGYVDTVDEWASVEDTNLEDNGVTKASVGQLLRWVSGGGLLDETTILISVGTIWYSEPYYFNTFTAKEMETITRSVRLSRRTLIFRTSTSESEFAMAEWILSVSGKITGVRLTAKSATSTNPYVRVCPIDMATGTKSGDILALSEGGMRSYIPASPYVLPATIRVGPEISDIQIRPPRTNFKTKTSPALRVILKTMSDPPLKANPELASSKVDYFQGVISVFNNNAAASNNPITVASASASYRLVGDPTYNPCEALKITDRTELPITIEPRQSWSLKFEAAVPRSEEDVKLDVKWWNRAIVARHRPIRIKITLEDIEGEKCSLVLEYVFKPYPFNKPGANDIAEFFFDDPVLLQRNCIRVEKCDAGGTGVVKIAGNEIETKRLEKIVYRALKTGKTEVDLEIGQEKDYGAWEWAAWALVDFSCRRVYAFKIMVKEGKSVEKKRLGCLGYVLCPAYGESVDKQRPISYATEFVKLAQLEPYPVQQVVTDDAFDDFKPIVPPKPTISPVSPTSSSAQPQVPGDLAQRLTSIDSNLSRIATALERLVAHVEGQVPPSS